MWEWGMGTHGRQRCAQRWRSSPLHSTSGSAEKIPVKEFNFFPLPTPIKQANELIGALPF